MQDIDPAEMAAQFRAAMRHRVETRCERVQPDGTQCPLTATQHVDGDQYCDEHAAEA